MKSLVVYHSFTGKTRLAAQAIAEALSATLVEVEERRPVPTPFVYVSGGFRAFMNWGSKIRPLDVDLKQYERIFIGSPMWACPLALGTDGAGSIRLPASASGIVGLKPTRGAVAHGYAPDVISSISYAGPMTRTVADAARVLDVIAGYDPNDPITAHSVGHVTRSYVDALKPTALKGARIGVLRFKRDTVTARAPRDSAGRADTAAARRDSVARFNAGEFAKVAPLFERALADLAAQGAVLVDSLQVPTVPARRVGNDFETEEATDRYLAEHPNAPYKSLKEIYFHTIIGSHA